jgi:tyrosinase
MTMMFPRRTALKLMSVGAVTAFSGRVAFAQPQVPARRSLTNMQLDDPDLSTYRDFVGLMRFEK